MLTENEIELQNIENDLQKKLKRRESDLFYFDGDILSYEEMIELLARTVQQHLWDDEVTVDEIDQDQLDGWISKYEFPEQECSCLRGCNWCLGTEW